MGTVAASDWTVPVRRHFSAFGLSLYLPIAAVVLGALLTYVFTARANIELLRSQQQTTLVQQFEESGARMDSALSMFVDAMLDGSSVEEARKEARIAITLHASQSRNLEPIVGEGNVRQYLTGLGDLRRYVDDASDPKTATIMAQSHAHLMEYRDNMIKLARKNLAI